MKITIDQGSGCCFGVVSAIGFAETILESHKPLFCLGDIVHNDQELERLREKGLVYIDYATYLNLRNTTVLIRAHGEPPKTYKIALENNIRLIDASCPVVLRLQASIRKAYDESLNNNGQVVIFGKKGHAEVIGLLGQTFDKAIVISEQEDLKAIDFSRPVYLFAQTTQNAHEYYRIGQLITEAMQQCRDDVNHKPVIFHTICKLVEKRSSEIENFARKHDLILFVSDPKSSNGKYLFEICRKNNPNSYFISSVKDITDNMLKNVQNVGICGATSTPLWLMHEISDFLKNERKDF